MTKLYLMEVTPFTEEAVREKAMLYVGRQRRERALSMKQEGSRNMSLAAGLLLTYGLCCLERGIKEDDAPFEMITADRALAVLSQEKFILDEYVQIEKTPDGKPYFGNRPELFFSMSHSGEYAACVLSDENVGMDLQKRKLPCREALIGRVLGAEEHLENEAAFFDVWAAKEAYIKYTGDGLKKDLREIFVDFEKEQIKDLETGTVCRLTALKILPEYATAICSLH